MSERIVLRSPKLSAEFVPAQGGRLASLRTSGPEFDFFGPRAWSGGPASDSRAPQGVLGAEDLFPFRRGGRYPVAPYDKIEIPDLGDVRRRPWQHERRGGTVRLWTADKRFGYKLEKRISFPSPLVLRLDYRLDNVADDPLLFVWFGRVALPLHRAVRVVPPANRLWRRTGGAGAQADAAGDAALRERPGRIAAGAAASWMTDGPDGPVRCEWIDEAAGRRLVLDSPPESAPHLWLEADRGGIEPAAAETARVCLEPATAPHEAAEGLPGSPRCRLGPLQHLEWWLELSADGA